MPHRAHQTRSGTLGGQRADDDIGPVMRGRGRHAGPWRLSPPWAESAWSALDRVSNEIVPESRPPITRPACKNRSTLGGGLCSDNDG